MKKILYNDDFSNQNIQELVEYITQEFNFKQVQLKEKEDADFIVLCVQIDENLNIVLDSFDKNMIMENTMLYIIFDSVSEKSDSIKLLDPIRNFIDSFNSNVMVCGYSILNLKNSYDLNYEKTLVSNNIRELIQKGETIKIN